MLKVYAAIALGAAVSFAALSGYDSLPAAQKQDYLWQKIIADTKGDAFMNPLKTIIEVMNPANLWAMTTIHADWRDAGHHKATHGIGAHAKAHFEWKANNYTGMFKKADNCIIRMANAACPAASGLAKTAYGPNLAVKCTRDGVESANMQFLWQVDGYAVIPQGLAAKQTCSYFETPLSSHSPLRDDIAMPLRDTFITAFQKVDSRSMFVGVSQMATETQQGDAGNAPITPQFPFALVLKPAPGLNSVTCNFAEPISQLLNLEESGLGVPGKTLYEVYAAKDPNPESLEHLGSLVLDSSFTSSTFGDTQLFFRHTFQADEMKVMQAADPNRAKKWAEYVDGESNYKKEGANIYWPLLPVPPPVAPPCHVLVEDNLLSACKEDTDADSCAKGGDAEQPGTCTAAGFPVCCYIQWEHPLWYKMDQRCSGQENDCGTKNQNLLNTVAVAPPCHVTANYQDECREFTNAESCAMGYMKTGSCTASGFPVCCTQADGLGQFWHKAGVTCPDTFVPCGPQMLQSDVTIV